MTKETRSEPFEVGRRQYLSTVGLLGTLPVLSGESSQVNTTDKFSDRAQVDEVAAPPYPGDVFMPGQYAGEYLSPGNDSGWEEASIQEEYSTLLGLHLDVFDSAGLPLFRDGELTRDQDSSRALSLSLRTGLPATAGFNNTLGPDQEKGYQPIVDENDWEFPDGSSLDTVSGSYAETFNGDNQSINFGSGIGMVTSAFGPLGLHLLETVSTIRLNQGFSGFFLDKVFIWQGLDFSDWATAAFRERIQSLPSDRQERLGIENPSTFDVKEYLRDNNLTPDSDQDPRENPVFQEYVIHNHLGIRSYLASWRDTLTGEFPERFEQGDTAIWANQFTGSLTGPQAVNIYGSQYFDVINTELFPTVNPASDFKYKILQAVGNFEKPVIAKGAMSSSLINDSELDPANNYPNLERFQLAETHANGARLKIPLSTRGVYPIEENITHWIRNDGSIPGTLQNFADFVWTHKRFLTDSEPGNSVAVVWSLSDRMYRRLPQWNINYESNPGVNSFIGTAKLLREAQIPYSVLVFGHPDLWDDSKQLERLSEHDAVILPGMQCLSDAQHSALEEYLADDGFLVASGSPPSRTSRYESRNDVNQLFDDENAVILEDNPALSREENGTVGGQLQDALADAGIVPVAESQDSTLSVNIRNQPEDDRTVVHLLNYDYSKQDDQFESKSNIKISAQSPDHSVSVARYYSDQQTTELEFESVDGEIEFTVPHLTDWGFVVLAPSESALIDTHVKSDAEEKVASLRNQIENTRQSGHDWSPTFTVAETHLEEATTALDAEAYTEALSAAEKGVSAASELTRQQPIVGIDLSHGQEFESANPFEDLKAEISYPDYRMIDSWSNDLIDELDILVIPPALTWRGNEHNFQQEEIDTITEFVEDGGSLVILARGGVAPDMEMLTSEFGYAFDGRGLQFPGGSSPAAPVVTDHELTQAVSKIYAQWAATITELPENATPLASLPEDNNATFDSDEEGDESGGGVPSEPIYAVSEHGDGTVAVLGSWGYIHSPSHLYNWTPLMHNLFSTLSERAVETDDVMTETITSTSTPPSETATSTEKATETVSNQETSTESPGFGVLTGLAGVTGAALFGKWRNSDKD